MIIGVTDEPPELVDEFVKTYEPSYPIVITKDRTLEQHLGVKGFPTAAVVEPSGKITWKDHFGYDDALDTAHKSADKVPLVPKTFAKVHKEIMAQDLPGAYGELVKVLDKGRLDESDQAFGDRARAWLEGEASSALARGTALVEDGWVWRAVNMVEPFTKGKTPFPNQQELETFIETEQARKGFKDEMKAGEMYAEANALARSKRTVKDGIELFDKLVKKYDDTAIAAHALDRLDQLEKYRD